MSIRIQRRIPAVMGTKVIEVQVDPAMVEVDFFVNLYRDAQGNIEQGTRTFRQERNAIAHGRDTEALDYIGTAKFTASVDA